MRASMLCLLLASCGPVLLGEEALTQDGSTTGEVGPMSGSAAPIDPARTREPAAMPAVSVQIKPLDCGRCFELQAQGAGGLPPYEFQWEDGSLRAERVVCVDNANLTLSVVARDAVGSRSVPQAIQLQRAASSECPQAMIPAKPAPPPKVCLKNLSLEGTPAANFGQDQGFDAAPWSACTNPAAANTPNIGNDSVAQTLGPIPKATDGLTFLALGEGEQVSQAFCSPLTDEAPVHIQIDLARLNIGAGIVPETEKVFLEVWGGLEVDCSQHEWLWASPPLDPGWKTYCMTLRPRSFMTQLTLRAGADLSLPTPAYLIADNLKLVDACP